MGTRDATRGAQLWCRSHQQALPHYPHCARPRCAAPEAKKVGNAVHAGGRWVAHQAQRLSQAAEQVQLQ